jgi:glutaredoxin-related protein
MEENKLYTNIIFKIEPNGFSLRAEDEDKQVTLELEFSYEGLSNSVRRFFKRAEKAYVASESLQIKDKRTGTLTEVIDFQDGPPFKYVDGEVIVGGGGEDILVEEKEKLNLDTYIKQYEQSIREKHARKQKKSK